MGELVAEVIAARDGDLAAFRMLVDRYRKPLCAFVATLVRDYHLAQDVAQNAFVQAHRRLAQLRDARTFTTWLFTIARHAALDFAKRRERGEALVDAVAERARHEPPPSPEPVVEDVARRELREILDAAILRLTPDQGSVLALRYWQGMTCGEIGEVLDISTEAVRVRLTRARRALRERLAGRLAPEGWGSS